MYSNKIRHVFKGDDIKKIRLKPFYLDELLNKFTMSSRVVLLCDVLQTGGA